MVYDRAGVAKRIRPRRKELGMSSAEVAGNIGRAVHYYGCLLYTSVNRP